jgi:hypothetical protein
MNIHNISASVFYLTAVLIGFFFIHGCAADSTSKKSDKKVLKQDGPKIQFKWSDIRNEEAAKTSLGKRYKKTPPALPGKGWEDITDKLDWRTFDMDASAGEILFPEDESGDKKGKKDKNKCVELYRKDKDGRTSIYAVFHKTGRFRMEADVFAKNIMSGAIKNSGKFQIFIQEQGSDANYHEGENHTGPNINESYIYHHRGWRRLRANLLQQDEEKQTVFRISLQYTSGTLKIANLRVFYQPIEAD